MFNTDESEIPGKGAYKRMLAKSRIATWGPFTGNHLIARPVASDIVFFYLDKKGVIAKAVFTEAGPFRSNDIFGKEDEEEFSRDVVDLVILPDDAPIRPAEVVAALSFHLPFVGSTPRKMRNAEVVDYLLTRFPVPVQFVDQFNIGSTPGGPPEKKEVKGYVFVRSEEVRRLALLRAKGQCEWCETPGFETASGSIYLETHHVVPLSEGGPDAVSNVIAICPNHHREAHHAKGRDEMRQEFLLRIGTVHRTQSCPPTQHPPR